MKIRNITKFIIITSIALSSLSIAKTASANKLMVTPTRVEFSGRDRTKEVKLVNRGDKETSYRISFQHLRMNQDGSYTEIKSGEELENEKFVDKIVRYSPRRVTLKPSQVQTIRLMLRRSKAQEGEYRSHMLFREEASADFGTNIEKTSGDDKKISIILKPLFGISIPVIARIGETNAAASIEKMEVRKGKEKDKLLYVRISRTGNASTYGDIIVNLTPKNSDKKYQIGIINGISAFYPYNGRDVLIKLNIPKDVRLREGLIEATYYNKQKDLSTTDKDNILASKSITY